METRLDGRLDPSPEEMDVAIVQAVQESLVRFAEADFGTKTEWLPGLFRYIDTLQDPALLDALVDKEAAEEWGEISEAAFNKAAQTPVMYRKVVDDKLVYIERKPWLIDQGEFQGTLVLLREDGKIADIRGTTAVEFEEFGDLRRLALQKALLLQWLDDAGAQVGGLLEPENFERIIDEFGLRPYTELFSGGATEPVMVNGQLFYIGTSGCMAERSYLAGLISYKAETDEEAREVGVEISLDASSGRTHAKAFPADAQSGVLDNFFADVYAGYLEDPRVQISVLPEPRRIRQLRYGK